MSSPLFLLLSACPPPVSTALATAVSDKLAPSVVVTSPSTLTFQGSVHFAGTITDDAVSSGDGKGNVRSIEYTTSNDNTGQRQSRLLIDSSGTTSVDTSFGSGTPISWNAATHSYAFDVSSVTPFVIPGFLQVTINATDENGNVQKQVVSLAAGQGPSITITQPASSFQYSLGGGTILNLVGKVYDAAGVTTATNIKTLTWGVQGKTWGATISVPSGVLSVSNALFSLANFVFNPANGDFSAQIQIPSVTESTLTVQVSATDFNGNSPPAQTVNITAIGANAPQILIVSPPPSPAVAYYSSANFAGITVSGIIATTDISNLSTLTYKTSAGTWNSPSSIGLSPTDQTAGATFSGFDPTTGAFSFVISPADSTSLQGHAGPAKIVLTATGANLLVSNPSVTIQDDPTAPTLTAAITNGGYAKAGDIVHLTYTATDTGSGLSGDPALTIMGAPISPSPTPVSGTYTYDYTVQNGDSGTFQFLITSSDLAGNTATRNVTNAANTVTLYTGMPTLGSVHIAGISGNAAWAVLNTVVTLSFATTRDLLSQPVVTIAGRPAAVSPSTFSPTNHSYTATITMNGTDAQGTIPFTIDFTDAAGNAGAQVTSTTDSSSVTYDRTAPAGYTVSIDQGAYVNNSQKTAMSFHFAGAEIGTTFNWSVTDGVHAPVSGSGTISSAAQQVTGISVTGLNEGTLTLSATLTDPAGNVGSPATTTATKDTTPPAAFTVSIDQGAYVNNSQKTAMSFTFASATVGATYSYTVSDGVTTVGPFTGSVTSATQQITGINVSTLAEGTVTLSVTLTDAAGNTTSPPSTDTATKDTIIPSGYTVSFDQAYANLATVSAMSFTFAGAEIGTTYNYSITGTSGGPVTGGPTAITSATQQKTGINLSTLGQGTVTLSVTLTDAAGNVGTAATSTATKDTVAPATTYTVPIDQAYIYSGNKTAMSFTFGPTAAETPTTYNFTVTSSGGGTPVSGSGPLSSSTQQVPGIDVSGLTDGTLTLTVKLTDVAGNQNTGVTSTVLKDTTPPAAFTVSIDQGAYINNSQKTAMSFTFAGAGAAVGTAYSYTVSDGVTTLGPFTGTVPASLQITGINVSTLAEGTITLSATLTDNHQNTTSPPSTDTATKDTIIPSGYTVSFDQAYANLATVSAMSFTFAGAEIGTTYNYSITGTSGGPVTGGPTAITSATQQKTGINLSTLGQGTVTLSVTLTDAAGNVGTAATSTATKDTVAPTISTGSSSVLDVGSATAHVVFSEAVYGDPGASSAISAGSLQFEDTKTGSTQTISPDSNDATPGATTVVFNLTWNPAIAGSNDPISILVPATTGNMIYDVAGNLMAATTVTAGAFKARTLTLIGSVQQSMGSAARAASFLLAGLESLAGLRPTAPHGAATAAAREAAPVTPAAGKFMQRAPADRTQFYQPLTARADDAEPAATAAPKPATGSRPGAGTASAPTQAVSGAPAAAQPTLAAAATSARATASVPATPSASAAASRHAALARAAGPQPSSPEAPTWWVVTLGLIAIGLAGAAAWMALRFVRGRTR